jgi:uncharacterized membrane protein required for colicin V production
MILDITFLVIVVIFALIGYYKGILNQIFTFTAFVLAIIFGPTIAKTLINSLDLSGSSHSEVYMMGMSIAFGIAIYFLVKFIFTLAEKVILGENYVLNNINKGLGATLGLVKAVIVLLIVVFIMTTQTPELKEKVTRDSRITSMMEKIVPFDLFDRIQEGNFIYFRENIQKV